MMATIDGELGAEIVIGAPFMFTIYVLDQDKAKAFYVDILGMKVGIDQTSSSGIRWLTVHHPHNPSAQITLVLPLTAPIPSLAAGITEALEARMMPSIGFLTNDCQKTYETLSRRGVEFMVTPQNRVVEMVEAVRPHLGVEAVFYDGCGNFHVLMEPTDPDNISLWPRVY